MTPIIQVDSQSQPLQLLLVKAQPNPGSQEASFLPPTHQHTPKSHLSALVVVNINSIPSPGRERWFARWLVVATMPLHPHTSLLVVVVVPWMVMVSSSSSSSPCYLGCRIAQDLHLYDGDSIHSLSLCPFAHVQLIISPNRNRDQGIETCGWGWGRGCHGTFSDTWKLW